ncbi:MAG: carboxypeptidase-like regulatory domain-containing protein [Bacteroidota bacterium]
MNNKSFLIVLLCLFISISYSQDDGDFLLGRVLDQETGKPIPFVTIKVVGKNLGVISNADGGFKVPIRFQIEGEKLEISCMGYEKKEVPFSNLTKNEVNIIYLKTGFFELQETTVTAKQKRPPSPRRILKRAIEKIPENYPTEAFSYVGYYRDYQEKDDEYLNLNEAILEIFDSGFGKNDYATTQAQIYNYTQNLEFARDSNVAKPYDYLTKNKIINNAKLFSFGGNEFYILRIHDAIRNYKAKTFSYVDVMEKDLIRNHRLTRKKDVFQGDEKMFVIGMEGSNSSFTNDGYSKQKVSGNIRSEGEIYISQSSYAMHKMVYKVFDYTKKRKPTNDIQQTESNLLFEIVIEYERYGEKMYPNYLSLHNLFSIRREDFYVEQITLDLERKRFVINTNNPPILLLEWDQPNVVLRYKNKRVGLIDVENTYNGIFVYPNKKQMDEILQDPDFSINQDGYISGDFLQFEYANIVDSNQNVLNKIVYEDYFQYREFFTQKVITDPISFPANELLMKKNSPIFKNQPITQPDNLNEFWMNTPLKERF